MAWSLSVTYLCARDNHNAYITYILYSDFLKNILEQYPKFYHEEAPKYFTESGWVGSRLAEILPMQKNEKQVILETEDYLVRLYRIKDYIDSKKLT